MIANYLLVTAAKDEIQFLPQLVESVMRQTLRPILWIMVDDGSEDGTAALMDAIAYQHTWVKVIHRGKGPRHGLRYALALREGFNFAEDLCSRRNVDYGYLGLVDADVALEPAYFERLILEFKRNPRLGLASGGIYHYDENDDLVLEVHRTDWPRGPQRLWRRECYEQIGGQPVAKSADSVGNVKVRYAGWEMRSFREIQAIARATGTSRGHWAHCVYAAESAYYLHYHPVLVIMKAVAFLWHSPHYGIVPFVGTYLREWIFQGSRCEEAIVQDYYGRQRLREYWEYVVARLLGRKAKFEIHWQEELVK
jgi:glycosyltransferase involved in cell wall biosynthesis